MYLKKKIYLLIIILLVVQSFFEIILYYDYLLHSFDTTFQFEKLRNFIENGVPKFEFYPESNFGWDKFDLFEFFTVLTNKVFFLGLNLNLNIKNFIIFETTIKIFILISSFLLIFFKFKNLNLSIFALIFILADASFMHVIHNVHHYLILALIICFFIFNKINYEKNNKINYILIGLILTYGCLSIAVSGLVIGTTFIISILYFYKKNVINIEILYLLIFGSLLSITIYLYFNFSNIFDLYNLNIDTSFNFFKKITYTIKYTILNFYFLIFGQHGNNFILIYLLYLFAFAKELDNKFDKNLLTIIKIYLVTFVFFGILIDPMHYYPSRIGLLTPFVIYLLIKLFLKKTLFISYKINLLATIFLCFSFFHHVTTQLDYISRTQNFFITLSLSVLIIFFINLIKSKKIVRYNFIIFLICITFKFFPYFKMDHLKNNFNTKNLKLIHSSIDQNLDLPKDNCVISNYANNNLFKNRKLVSINASGEHINKKNAFGKSNCDVLILFINQITQKELLPYKKIMSLKKLNYKISQKDLEYFYFKGNMYKIYSVIDIDHIKIFYSIKITNIDGKLSKVLHLSYY